MLIFLEELKRYKELHFTDRQQPRFYIQYMVSTFSLVKLNSQADKIEQILLYSVSLFTKGL